MPVTVPAIVRFTERSDVAMRWPRAHERHYGDWVLDRLWSDPRIAKMSLGFGAVAINQSDVY